MKKAQATINKEVRKKVSGKGPITIDMTLGEVITKYPDTAMVMYKYGLHCIGCHVATWETIKEGCAAHGISDEDIDKMVAEMNAAVKK